MKQSHRLATSSDNFKDLQIWEDLKPFSKKRLLLHSSVMARTKSPDNDALLLVPHAAGALSAAALRLVAPVD